jgi:hypothetical protein
VPLEDKQVAVLVGRTLWMGVFVPVFAFFLVLVDNCMGDMQWLSGMAAINYRKT